jgi:prepilin-type N-terminal cleavage/methylation domain-containing protein/prepilin-type processing-associated H-X9-DG protein
MKTSKTAFTLIELLTVIAVIAILAAILIPVVSKVRHQAQATEAISNIRQVGAAALLYANEHGGKVPGLGNDSTTNGMGTAGALFPYLEARTMDGFPTWEELQRTYRSIRDPRLPEELVEGGWKWIGYNGLFSDYSASGPNAQNSNKNEKRLLNFERPNHVIYAASGNGNLSPQLATDSGQLPIPSSPRRGFYFVHDGSVPAVFLDGHAEMLPFPIDPTKLNPDFEVQN